MMGNETVTVDGRVVRETDFVMCGHCQTTVDVTPGKSVTDAGSYCSDCGTIVCPRCAKVAARTMTCTPWDKVMDQEDKALETLRRWGIDPTAAKIRLILPT